VSTPQKRPRLKDLPNLFATARDSAPAFPEPCLNYNRLLEKLVGAIVIGRIMRNIRQNRGDQPLRRKRLGNAAQARKQEAQSFELRPRRGVARKTVLELPRFRSGCLAVQHGMHQFNESRVAHVSPAGSPSTSHAGGGELRKGGI